MDSTIAQNAMYRCSPFEPGSIYNALNPGVSSPPVILHKEVTIDYPSRLNAMAIDPGQIAPREDRKYRAGEVVFAVDIFKRIHIRTRKDGEIKISERTKRHALVSHAALLMRQALHAKEGFDIDVENNSEIRHCGLGSSSALLAGVAAAINEAYGNPVSRESLLRYLAQNHGEEIEGDPLHLNPVQCIGGSAAAGLCEAGMIVLAGEATPILTAKLSSKYRAIIGIPSDFKESDSEALMAAEMDAMPRFLATAERYSSLNAYNILHRMLPAMKEGRLDIIGDVILEYRHGMGSIENCSFAYPRLPEIFEALLPLKTSGVAPILSVSSVGPGIFAITDDPKACAEFFKSNSLSVFEAGIQNEGYRIIEKISA